MKQFEKRRRRLWLVAVIVFCVLLYAAGALLLTGCSLENPLGVPTPTSVYTKPSVTLTSTVQPVTLSPGDNLPMFCVVAYTEGDILNLRRGPGMQYEILGGLLPGQRLTVITWASDWVYVSTGDQAGYIYRDYCEVTK